MLCCSVMCSQQYVHIYSTYIATNTSPCSSFSSAMQVQRSNKQAMVGTSTNTKTVLNESWTTPNNLKNPWNNVFEKEHTFSPWMFVIFCWHPLTVHLPSLSHIFKQIPEKLKLKSPDKACHIYKMLVKKLT